MGPHPKLSPEQQAQIRDKTEQFTAKLMAYRGNDNSVSPRVYRMERGFPYPRQGARQIVFTSGGNTIILNSNVVPPYPQFKGLYLYSQAASQVQPAFRQTMTSTRVRWPVSPGGQTETGS